MADNEQLIKINLDSKEFIHSAQEAKKVLGELGDVENISGLLAGFETLGLALGVVGAAFLAVKSSFDLAFDAEKIQKLNDQFELLSKNANVSYIELKEGMEKAANGMISTTELLQMANKAIVELGVNADKIPALMEVARKASSVMGTDMTESFDRITRAVATGNVTMLKRMGLVVDNTKSQVDYANAHHKMVDDLTAEEQKIAALNAVLNLNSTSLKGVKTDVDNLTNTWKQMKVAASEIGESFALIANKYINPVLKPAVTWLKDAFHALNTVMKKDVGEGATLAGNNLEYFSAKVGVARQTVLELQDKLSKVKDPYVKAGMEEDLIAARAHYTEMLKAASKYQADLKKDKEKQEESIEKPEAGTSGAGAAQLKMNEEILKIKAARIKEEISMDESYDQMQTHRGEQLVNMHDQVYTKIAEIQANAAGKDELTQRMAALQKEELLFKYAEDVKKVTEEMKNDQLNAANNAAKASAMTTDGIGKGFKAAALSASKDLGNMAVLGQQAFNALNKNGKSAFIALGDGSKSAGDAMKMFLLGSIADVAEAQGEFLLASGIGTFDPIQIAEGGALLSLSGLLRSLAGGGSSGGIGAGSGGGASGASSGGGATPSTATDLQATQAQQANQRNVTIAVSGNYFETEQTKRTLMEMIRQETDATSFSYVQINQGGAS
jgi:hypothetical protein